MVHRIRKGLVTHPLGEGHHHAFGQYVGFGLRHCGPPAQKGFNRGETGRAKGPQGELTDLFLSTSGEVVGLGELSPTERLFQRAQELNERLTVLVALTRRERKPRASKSTRASTEKDGENAADS